MGRRRARTILDHPDAALVMMVDSIAESAASAGAEMGVQHGTEYREVVARTDVDCVVVSVPNKLHPRIVAECLESGKHVFCEKPLARNVAEAKVMVDAAQRSGRTLKTGSNLRFFPNVLKARALLDEGAIGDLMFLRTWIGHGGWTEGGWFSDVEQSGGGTFLDNGCHILDISRWVLGEVRSCVGMVSTNALPIAPMEDNGFGIFEMDGGRTATVQASWTEWAGYMYMEIYGREGFVRIDNRGRSSLTVLGNRRGEETLFDYSDDPSNSYVLEMDDYVRTIRAGGQPYPSGLDGMRAVEMAWGVYESAKTGQRVKL